MRLASPTEIGLGRCTSCNSCLGCMVFTDKKVPWAEFCSQGCKMDFLRRLG